ncbi:MAG: hypothetical protein K1X95_13350, partial [Acidimicrobiia bacterium]|nr:hypothetical protein [Acidimicrobiia bacterium]
MPAIDATVDQLADLLGQRARGLPVLHVGARAPELDVALAAKGHEVVQCDPDPSAMHALPDAIVAHRDGPRLGAVVLREVLGTVPAAAGLTAAARTLCDAHSCELIVVEPNEIG